MNSSAPMYRSAHTRTLLFTAVLLLISSALSAQPAVPPDTAALPSPIRFAGRFDIYGQAADRRGQFQEVPDDYVRADLRPTLLFYGVPFTLSVQGTTEQDAVRQNINSVAFELDYSKLEGALIDRLYTKIGELEAASGVSDVRSGIESGVGDITGAVSDAEKTIEELRELADPDALREEGMSRAIEALGKFGLVQGAERFFANFPALGVGVIYPRYTDFTLKGVPLNGGILEWNPNGGFFIGGMYGRTRRAIPDPRIPDSLLPTPSFEQQMVGGRIGYGRKTGNRALLTVLHAQDDPASLPDGEFGTPRSPQSNWVLDLDLGVPIIPNAWKIEAELAGSMTTGDRESPNFDSNDVPGVVQQTFEPNISTSIDYAFKGGTSFKIASTQTRGKAEFRYIGPGYATLGAPRLRNDLMSVDGRLDQSLAKKRVRLSGFFRREQDNIASLLKSGVTTITAWGASGSVSPTSWPTFRAEIAPYSQHYRNNETGEELDFSMLTAGAGVTHRFKWLAGPAIGSLSLRRTAGTSPDSTVSYSLNMVDLRGTISPVRGLFLDVGGYYSIPDNVAERGNGIGLDGALGVSFLGSWYASAGVGWSDEQKVARRVDFRVGLSIPVWSGGTFDIRAERSVYDDLAGFGTDFQETILLGGISLSW